MASPLSQGESVDVYRSCLKQAVLVMLKQARFTSVSPAAVDLLTMVYEDILCQMSLSIHHTSEHCGRTQPMFPDVVVALSGLGIDLQALPAFKHTHPPTMHIPAPQIIASSSQPRGLSSGRKQHFPSYIPEHLPEFPDPHSYTKSAIYKKPGSDLETVREKYSMQKSSSEAALTKYVTHTSLVRDVFGQEHNQVTIMKPKTNPRPYLPALLTPDIKLHSDQPLPDSHTTNKAKKLAMLATDVMKQEEDVGKAVEMADAKCQNAFLKPCKFPGAAKQIKKKGSLY